MNEKQVYEAFSILTADPQVNSILQWCCLFCVVFGENVIFLLSKVKVIFVNIFGGIVNCATIANGIVNACKSIKLQVPLVVRLQGWFCCSCF